MSSSRTKTERLEEFFEVKAFERSSDKRWHIWMMLVSSSLVVIPTAGMLFDAESARDATLPAGLLAFFSAVFGMFFGQGLCTGAFGRAAGGLRGFGRKLRLVCSISLGVVGPFYFASMGGDFAARQSGYSWTSGALVGGGVGLAFLLIICGRSFYRYRRLRDGSSAGG